MSDDPEVQGKILSPALWVYGEKQDITSVFYFRLAIVNHYALCSPTRLLTERHKIGGLDVNGFKSLRECLFRWTCFRASSSLSRTGCGVRQTNFSGCGQAWLSRPLWKRKNAGSNPATQTSCEFRTVLWVKNGLMRSLA